MMNKNKNKDQWLHQLMQTHRHNLDINIQKSHDDFTCKVMSQLPIKKPITEKLLSKKIFWNSLLCICVIGLIAVAWINGNLNSLFANSGWFNDLIFKFKQILNILLQLNPRSSMNINRGLLLLTSLPWIKYMILVSVMLTVVLFEWKSPSYMRKNRHSF